MWWKAQRRALITRLKSPDCQQVWFQIYLNFGRTQLASLFSITIFKLWYFESYDWLADGKGFGNSKTIEIF